jgi:hypothetical protein
VRHGDNPRTTVDGASLGIAFEWRDRDRGNARTVASRLSMVINLTGDLLELLIADRFKNAASLAM